MPRYWRTLEGDATERLLEDLTGIDYGRCRKVNPDTQTDNQLRIERGPEYLQTQGVESGKMYEDPDAYHEHWFDLEDTERYQQEKK